MQSIRLWSVKGDHIAEVNGQHHTKTEEHLEDILVRSPKLLMEQGVLIGRQVMTQGGPLDLIGIDEDGRIVIFELKRGTLTRDAVAQILDYASDLASMNPGSFARLIEDSSGKGGIDHIEDFMDWYSREYADTDLLAETPRMVLVGLGVDSRAKRMVNFLADTGLDIRLLTFHAFEVEGNLLLARQVETSDPAPSRSTTPAKESNRRILHETAQKEGVEDLLNEVVAFIDKHLPTAYRYPGKTAYSFSLQEKTSEGKPSLRSYVTLYVNWKRHGALLLTFPPRIEEVAPEAMEQFLSDVPMAVRSVTNRGIR